MNPQSILSRSTLEKSDAVIISAPYEKTASSRKGTQYGPKKIIDCLESKLEFFQRDYLAEACAHVNISSLPELALSKASPDEALKIVRNSCAMVLDKEKFPLLLGGEHSVTLGLLQALETKYDPHEVTILQIDAHCDLRDSDADYSSSPSNLAHSCVMRRAHELGYNLVQVGIRTYSAAEYEYFSTHPESISVFEWGLDKAPEIEEILAQVKTKYVYLTVDVDGFDPAYMPGTGTPVQGGLEWWYGVKLIKTLIKKFTLLGADIVEVSPTPDSVLTEYGASQLVYDILSYKFAEKIQKKL
ncbi:agmatinase [Candidatus Woesebacteria bacterium]|nr:agmatinase [Candidatus Woesebacteria bacterium]